MKKPIDERFDQYWTPEPNTNCWLWHGYRTRQEYGQFTLRRGLVVYSHRFSYERAKGKIPEGLELDHLCRVRCCVNPDHLEPVTALENCRRSPLRNPSVCKYGHALTEENIYRGTQRGRWVKRECKKCCYIRQKAYVARWNSEQQARRKATCKRYYDKLRAQRKLINVGVR